MSQYTISAGCGHTTTINLTGPIRERERRAEWMRSPSGRCNPCYAAAKREQERATRAADVQALVAQLRAAAGSLTPEQGVQLRRQLTDGMHAGTAMAEAADIILTELGY